MAKAGLRSAVSTDSKPDRYWSENWVAASTPSLGHCPRAAYTSQHIGEEFVYIIHPNARETILANIPKRSIGAEIGV
jgi:hypothetical protein